MIARCVPQHLRHFAAIDQFVETFKADVSGWQSGHLHNEESVLIKLDSSERNIRREKYILSTLNKHVGCCAIRCYNCPDKHLVLEKYEFDLRSLMKPDIAVGCRRPLVSQLIDSVVFLHTHNVAHCDLRPSKFLLKREGFMWNVKLCGFDSAVDLNSNLLNLTKKGDCYKYTPGWVSPEIFTGTVHLAESLKIDLFHLGLVVDVILREDCDSETAVLPRNTDEMKDVFADEAKFRDLLRCGDFTHQGLVHKLCALEQDKRGTIFEAKNAWLRASVPHFRPNVGFTGDILPQQPSRTAFMYWGEVVIPLVDTVMKIFIQILHQFVERHGEKKKDEIDKIFKEFRSGLDEKHARIRNFMCQQKEQPSPGDITRLLKEFLKFIEQFSGRIVDETQKYDSATKVRNALAKVENSLDVFCEVCKEQSKF